MSVSSVFEKAPSGLSLKGLQNIRNSRTSDRVLARADTGDEALIGEWAVAIAAEYDRTVQGVKNVLNNACRYGRSAFGVKWNLVRGTPYATSVAVVTKLSAVKKSKRKAS